MRVAGFLSLLAGLCASVEGAPRLHDPYERRTQTHTSTVRARHTELGQFEPHGHVPTLTVEKTRTIPHPITLLSTIHFTTTRKLKPVTVTETDFVSSTLYVTAAANTDVISVTSTEFETDAVSLTPSAISSTVSTDVTTTVTSTSTIEASGGFLPIASTLPTDTAVASIKQELIKRELDRHRSRSIGLKDLRHPQAVKCIEETVIETTIIEIVVGKPITKTVPASRITTRTTSVITATSTIIPSAISSTFIYTTTSTLSPTTTLQPSTITLTPTNTVTASSTASFYAACATPNIAGSPLSSDFGSAAGEYITQVLWTPAQIPGSTLLTGDASSAYDCCVSCIQDDSCAFSTFGVGYCYLVNSRKCSGSNYANALVVQGESGGPIQVSNGNCGVVIEGSG
ncbi:hypothetical protein N7510_003387 [Penicillium lagena]|uniref:uncharacterized protein n=1 Tax=Penicillium lagena TaxID=94218 RepID=UPI002541CF95|nr:uncharacterized protein N7510_003387 [Penicillium lagena]KAJ5619403.1 hypothetical protein N7510_003387 [Penicillium lagena]